MLETLQPPTSPVFLPPDRRETLAHLTARLDEEPPGPGRSAVWREIQRIAAAAAWESLTAVEGCVVRIFGDPFAALSPNLRLHHMERATRVAYWRQLARIAWLTSERREYHCRCRIEILLRRPRAVDPDNALAACKCLIDGLVRRPERDGLLRGDRDEDVEIAPLRQEKVRRGNEEVVINVIPLEEATDGERDLHSQFR